MDSDKRKKKVKLMPLPNLNFKSTNMVDDEPKRIFQRNVKKKYKKMLEKKKNYKQTKNKETTEMLSLKKNGKMIIDTKETISNIEKGEHYIQLICDGLTKKSSLISSNTFCLVYLIRIVTICIPILCLQSIPKI